MVAQEVQASVTVILPCFLFGILGTECGEPLHGCGLASDVNVYDVMRVAAPQLGISPRVSK